MSDYPMLISNKLHSFRNFGAQKYRGRWHEVTEGLKNTVKKFHVIFLTPLLRNYCFFGPSPIFCNAKYRGEG